MKPFRSPHPSPHTPKAQIKGQKDKEYVLGVGTSGEVSKQEETLLSMAQGWGDLGKQDLSSITYFALRDEIRFMTDASPL